MHPVFFHIGRLSIPTFGVLAMSGLLCALALSERTAPMCGLGKQPLWDAGIFAVLVAFFASRLLLVVTNFTSFRTAPLLLLTVPSLTAGGLLLTAGVMWVYLRRQRLRVLAVMDAWTAPGLLLWGALALGHFAESSDPGMPVARFGLRTSMAGYREEPVALYAAVVAWILAAVMLRVTARPHGNGHVAATGLVLAGVAQFSLTFLRLPYLYARPTAWAVLDPIEWVGVGMVATGIAVMVASAMTSMPTSMETRPEEG